MPDKKILASKASNSEEEDFLIFNFLCIFRGRGWGVGGGGESSSSEEKDF